MWDKLFPSLLRRARASPPPQPTNEPIQIRICQESLYYSRKQEYKDANNQMELDVIVHKKLYRCCPIRK